MTYYQKLVLKALLAILCIGVYNSRVSAAMAEQLVKELEEAIAKGTVD